MFPTQWWRVVAVLCLSTSTSLLIPLKSNTNKLSLCEVLPLHNNNFDLTEAKMYSIWVESTVHTLKWNRWMFKRLAMRTEELRH